MEKKTADLWRRLKVKIVSTGVIAAHGPENWAIAQGIRKGNGDQVYLLYFQKNQEELPHALTEFTNIEDLLREMRKVHSDVREWQVYYKM